MTHFLEHSPTPSRKTQTTNCMINLSNSIPKSGSTHLANLQEDILSHCNVKNGQEALREYYKGR
jgi:hypothetical protein